MSDDQPSLLLHADSSDAVTADQATPPSGPSPGQMLKQARLRAGLTLEELGGRVKVTVARLQALEDDRTEAWPDVNVMRAAASSVCRHVQLNPVLVLDRLPKAGKIQLAVAGTDDHVGFRDRRSFSLRRTHKVGRHSLILVLGAVLLLAVLVFVGPMLMAWAERAFAREVPVVAPSVAGAVTDPVLPPDAGPTDTRVGVVTPEPQASAPLESTALVPAAPSEPVVVIKAKGLTWITVSDAKGVTLLRKTLSAGQSASTSGALPLWVVVGRADNAEVTVRGQAVALEPSVPDNVAKFKVQ